MSIAENIKEIRNHIPEGVQLVCVSKFHPCEAIMEAYAAGERRFGENRPQEMQQKAPQLPQDIEWHFIGNLQTNKVKTVVPIATLIHSVSNERLFAEIERCAAKAGKVQDVLVELHVASEETKQGFSPDEAIALITPGFISAHPHTRICGVMGMASNTDDKERIRADFRAIAQTFRRMKETAFSDAPHFRHLSMGMSSDYGIAIEEGATIVRVGSSIFGARDYGNRQ